MNKEARIMTYGNRGGPLQGVRVVELTKVWAGPFAGKLLAYLGAEVIRVESMGSLDTTRSYNVGDIQKSPGFVSVNPQKLSVQINTKSEEGLGILLDLIRQSDIFIENLRPGALDRLGLGYEKMKAVKEDIVYVSMGMHGNDGPLAYQSGYAPCFAALSGLSAIVGYEGETPLGMNIRYGDSTFGTTSAYAAVVALMHRRRTGQGQFVDVSAVEALSTMIGDTVMDYSVTGRIAACDGNRHPDMAPHAAYPCRDEEWISIAVSSDAVWRALAGAMGKPDLAEHPDFATLSARKANEVELDRLVSEWSAGQDAGQLAAQLQKLGVPAAKSMNSVELTSDQHLWGRGFYPVVSRPDGESRPTVGTSWKMSRPAAITDVAPTLGQHNSYIFGDVLGLSAEEQKRLVEEGITV